MRNKTVLLLLVLFAAGLLIACATARASPAPIYQDFALITSQIPILTVTDAGPPCLSVEKNLLNCFFDTDGTVISGLSPPATAPWSTSSSFDNYVCLMNIIPTVDAGENAATLRKSFAGQNYLLSIRPIAADSRQCYLATLVIINMMSLNDDISQDTAVISANGPIMVNRFGFDGIYPGRGGNHANKKFV